jgi:hypothetical protein
MTTTNPTPTTIEPITFEILPTDTSRCDHTIGMRSVGRVIDYDDDEINLENTDDLVRGDTTNGKQYYGNIGIIGRTWGEVWREDGRFIAQFREAGAITAMYAADTIEGIYDAAVHYFSVKEN